MLQDLTVKVEKATYDFDQKLVDFVRQMKKALDDGWQFGSDIPVVLSATMADLVPALQELSQVTAEKTESLEAFLRTHLLSSLDLAKAVGALK